MNSSAKNADDYARILAESFPFEPTVAQREAQEVFSKFLFQAENDHLFLLTGYAGTGKTTLLANLVNQLSGVFYKSVLLAPTGRAAKVLSNYAGKRAFTIHKRIYFPKPNKSGRIAFTRQQNKHTNTIFVVDEGSMIQGASAASSLFESGSLLADLIDYVNEGKNCKLMIVGDTAQLPPVKVDLSPALDPEYLAQHFHKKVSMVTLDEVLRQSKTSGILLNATTLRQCIQSKISVGFAFNISGYRDIIRLQDGRELQEAIEDAHASKGAEETIVVVRSNKRANLYNQQIRNHILFRTHQLNVGDLLMVVKNNYFWLKPTSTPGFIANGDIVRVEKIQAFKNLYGFSFAEITAQLVDYPDEPAFETVVILDVLDLEAPTLTYEQTQELYNEIQKDYAHLKSKYQRFRQIKESPFYNALQVKFAYAITCHKSQGGQWNTVFVEQPYLPNGTSVEYYRWLYTAITRASNKLYLIGFSNDVFVDA